MAAHVALLRGINVGGKNPLAMAALVELFAAAGAESPRTYIQSGNVVFRAPARVARGIPAAVSHAIATRFRIHVPITLRTADELDAITAACPFPAGGKLVHVMFLAAKPAAKAIAALDPRRSPPDAFAVRGREIYVHYPDGSARTKLGASYFESALGIPATARNWNTVLALRDLAAL
jgi:uncharacterized protein (DUF1697 family)